MPATHASPYISPAEHRVLEYLKQAGSSEARAIARSLRVTPMAVRHHLAVLEKAGLVGTTLDRGGLGRPHHVYSLSAAAEVLFPKQYGELAGKLIRTIVHLDGETKVARLFKYMKKDAVARAAPRMAGKPLGERVAEMARIMTEAGYMAEWEQVDAHTFQITERNCAISCVAQECQYACDAELNMMAELLNATVSRQEYMVAGDPICRYVIKARPKQKPSSKRKPRSSRS